MFKGLFFALIFIYFPTIAFGQIYSLCAEIGLVPSISAMVYYPIIFCLWFIIFYKAYSYLDGKALV